MQQHCEKFPVKKMAKTFKVSRAGYYQSLNNKESKYTKRTRELTFKIRSIYKESRCTYGSPRVHAMLKKQGEKCSRKRVAKIMKQNHIQSKIRKKWKAATRAFRDISKIAPNLLNQDFSATAENKVWVLDITYVATREGWLYVSTVLDLYSRKIVGLCMNKTMDTNLVIKSLNQAVYNRRPKAGLILHSDRGTQYTSFQYKDFASKHGFTLSMSAKGNCYDNAAMESFFHTLKTEHVFFYDFATREEAKQSIFEYIEVFYNRQRIHSTLDFLSPAEFERQSRVKLALPAIEARV